MEDRRDSGASSGSDPLDEIGRRTLRLDFASSLLLGATVAVLEMGGAIAKRGFDASDAEIALLTSGQSAGLILSFLIAHWAARGPRKELVFLPELARSIALGCVFFVGPGFALAFVLLHAAAQMCQSMTIPARVTIYRMNYPDSLRGRIIGRNRQVQLFVAMVVAVAMSGALEWSAGMEAMTAWLGPAPVSAGAMIRYVVPCVAVLGLAGTLLFRAVPLREDGATPALPQRSLLESARLFVRVWKEDRAFRRYETFFLVFGFANIMTVPLTQIHAVDVLHANYFELALINVVLVQGLMAVTMVFWGKLVDRHPPARLRGVLNLIFSIDLLMLAIAPSLPLVYVGRACRGIALGGGTLVWMLGSLYYARRREEVPIYLGIHTVLTGFRWLAAPFAGVLLKDLFRDNARPVFLVSFLLVVATAIVMLRTKEPAARRPLEGPPMPAPRTPGA